MAARERRPVSPMIAILVEEALDARDGSQPIEGVIVTLPKMGQERRCPTCGHWQAGPRRRTMTFLDALTRKRLDAFAKREGRTLDNAPAILCLEAFEARKRAAARKSA